MDTLSDKLLLGLLQENRDGISEYDLMQALQENAGLPRWQTGDNLALFRAHFMLRHALYRLRDHLWQQQRFHLDITLTRLRLLPYQKNATAVDTPDPLRDYYLDLNNLEDTGEAEINQMLDKFWLRFFSADEKQQALSVLELSEPVTLDEIKHRYRQLASRHHPDKGGDAHSQQMLNQAMQVLKNYYA